MGAPTGAPKENLFGKTLPELDPGGCGSRPAPLCRPAAGPLAVPRAGRHLRGHAEPAGAGPRLAGRALRDPPPGPDRGGPVRRRHAQVPVPRRRPLRGSGLHSGGQAGHPVPVRAGGLQDGLPVLPDRAAGLPGPPRRRRDPQPGGEPAGAGAPDQPGLHGHGRAAGQPGQRPGQPGGPHRRLGLRLQPLAHHGLDGRAAARHAALPGGQPLPPGGEPALPLRGGAAPPDAGGERLSAARGPARAARARSGRPAPGLVRVHPVRRPERHPPARPRVESRPAGHPRPDQPDPLPPHPGLPAGPQPAGAHPGLPGAPQGQRLHHHAAQVAGPGHRRGLRPAVDEKAAGTGTPQEPQEF